MAAICEQVTGNPLSNVSRRQHVKQIFAHSIHTLGLMLPLRKVECLVLIRNACTRKRSIRGFRVESVRWEPPSSSSFFMKPTNVWNKIAIKPLRQITFEPKCQANPPCARTTVEAPQRYLVRLLRPFLQNPYNNDSRLRSLVATIISIVNYTSFLENMR